MYCLYYQQIFMMFLAKEHFSEKYGYLGKRKFKA